MPTRSLINQVIFTGIARPKTKKSVRNQTVCLSLTIHIPSNMFDTLKPDRFEAVKSFLQWMK